MEGEKATDQGPKEEVDIPVEESPSMQELEQKMRLMVLNSPEKAMTYQDIIASVKFPPITTEDYLDFSESEPIKDSYDNIEEITGDIFDTDHSWALAHCVSEDLAMFRGVAVKFRRKYRNIEFLRKQEAKPGYVAVLHHVSRDEKEGRFIFYLVTKELYNHRPTYFHIYCSLVRLRILCEALNVTKIALPRIASGCDRMNFRRVKHLLHIVFQSSPVRIRVYKKIIS